MNKVRKKHGACKKDVHEYWYNNCNRGDWLTGILQDDRKLSYEQRVRIAIAFTEHILPIWQKTYRTDDRPQTAIKAAKKWLKAYSTAIRNLTARAVAAANDTDDNFSATEFFSTAIGAADDINVADVPADLIRNEKKWQAN